MSILHRGHPCWRVWKNNTPVSHRTWNRSNDSYSSKSTLDQQLLLLNQHFISMITTAVVVAIIITISIRPPIFPVRYQNKSHREEEQEIKDNSRSTSKVHRYRDNKLNRNSGQQWSPPFQVLLVSMRVSCRIKRVIDRFWLEIQRYPKSRVETMQCICLCLCHSCLMQGVRIVSRMAIILA